jgi:hypothetical protein
VPETEEALRTILTAYDIKPMICQEKGKTDKKEIKENKKRLQKLADSLGRRLVFAAPARDLDAAAAELGSLFSGTAAAPTPTKPQRSKKIAAPSKENGASTSAAANTPATPKSTKKAAANTARGSA